MTAKAQKAALAQLIKRAVIKRRIGEERRHEESLNMGVAGGYRAPLTPCEIERVYSMWGEIATPSVAELEVFKYFNGFDPRYVGHNLYLPIIARKLNCYGYTKVFENKALLDLFASPIKYPKTIAKCIHGEFYDAEMNQIGREEVTTICCGIDFPIIIKPISGTSGGYGVRKIMPSGEKQWCLDMCSKYGASFIVQECISQSEELAFFNESSVNTFRVTSLYLNGQFSICSIILRYGALGGITDNVGSGGNLVGVYEDGGLHNYGFDRVLNKVYEHNGAMLDSISFSFMPDMLNRVREWHTRHFSLCKFVGWDICVNSDNEYVVLETNTSQPGIYYEQIATGPIFGDRTQEVIEYIGCKEFTYDERFV